jgi:50S ribosomal protein L16 3-hydroxylase
VSYATPNGGVGPHFDYYDVFLVQGQGSRIWKTGQHCTPQDVSRTSSGLKLLAEFHTEQEWLLKPGDVLYVPPGVAHWGVSCDNSLCYSLGFRAPSLSEMVLGYSDAVSNRLSEDQRYMDPGLKPVKRPGEMDPASLQKMQRMLQQALNDKLEMNLWFGRHMTEPKNQEVFHPAKFMPDLHRANLVLSAHPASRFAWQQHGNEIFLFANGEMIKQPVSPSILKLVQQLCTSNSYISSSPYRKHKACRTTLETLLAQGALLKEEGR